MDNGTIDLKKLRRNLPPPPVEVAPLSVATPVPPQVSPSRAYAASAPIAAPAVSYRKRGIGRIPLPGMRHLLIGVVVIAVLLGGYYIYANFWSKSPFGPTSADTAESASAAATSSDMSEADIISAVGKIMLLPSDETPTLAKVSDLSALQSEAFFKNAALGDVVLMFPKSLRAILYDPLQGKIIEVGPITAGTTTDATSTSAVD